MGKIKLPAKETPTSHDSSPAPRHTTTYAPTDNSRGCATAVAVLLTSLTTDERLGSKDSRDVAPKNSLGKKGPGVQFKTSFSSGRFSLKWLY